MNKNNLLNQKLLSKTNIAVFCALGMVAGFFFSRAWMSFFTFAFGVNVLWNVHPKNWFKDKWWVIGAIWILIYGASWLWTADTESWSNRFDSKSPILLLPLAFAFLKPFNSKQIQVYTAIAASVFAGTAIYSLSFFVKDPLYYSEQYTFSHVLPTLPEGDHIRYSLSLSLFIVWCVSIFHLLEKRWLKVAIAVIVIFLSAYLHILAARTGLVVWYLFVMAWFIRYAFKKNLVVGIAIILALIISSALAVKFIPTLEKRVWYAAHSYELFKSGKMESGYSDLGRLISYKIAYRIISSYAVTGVGAGDINNEMYAGYDKWFPDVPQQYRLIPHNQFMIICLGCGILGMLIFTVWVLWPMRWYRKSKEGFCFIITWLSLVLTLFIEPMLELQFGVFVYLFFLLMQAHLLKQETVQTA